VLTLKNQHKMGKVSQPCTQQVYSGQTQYSIDHKSIRRGLACLSILLLSIAKLMRVFLACLSQSAIDREEPPPAVMVMNL